MTNYMLFHLMSALPVHGWLKLLGVAWPTAPRHFRWELVSWSYKPWRWELFHRQ